MLPRLKGLSLVSGVLLTYRDSDKILAHSHVDAICV